jgi:hypothetical protein
MGTLLIFKITWVVYAIGLLMYFNYWNYVFFEDTGKKYSMGIIVSCSLAILGVVAFILYRKKYEGILFIPFILLAFQLFSMYSIGIFPDESYNYFNDPRLQTINLIILVMLLYWNSKKSGIADVVPKLSVPLFAVFTFISFMRYTRNWKAQQEYTQPVFELREKIQTNDEIMTDYKTHQAFLGFKNLYCMDRLPCKVDKGYTRFWPENFDKVAYKLGTTTTWFIAESKRNNELFSMKEHETIFDNKFIALKYLRVENHEN